MYDNFEIHEIVPVFESSVILKNTKIMIKFPFVTALFILINLFHNEFHPAMLFKNNERNTLCDDKQYLLDSVYLEYKSLDSNYLHSKINRLTFKDLLLSNKGSTFYPYLDSDFQDHFSKFSHKKLYIKNYGNVEIGIFEFKDDCCSRQGKNYFMINKDKKELTIWYIENLYFENNYIITEYNTRGNISLDTIVYSNELHKFIPFCKQ